MKKQLFYASALMLGLSLASCSNEDESLNFQDNSFTVEASLKKQSRTLLEADSKAVVWSNGDQIYLFGGDSYSTMTLSAGAGEDEGTFNGLIYGSMDELEKALYPVPNVDGESYTYDFPAEKEWSENSQSPMIGNLEEGNIAFKNLVAMIRIDLDGCEYDNNSILTLELGGQPISGTATVDVEGEALTIGQGGNTVKVTKFGDARFVDIPVPAGEYKYFKVTIDNTTIIDKQRANTLGKDDVLIDGKVATEDEVEKDKDGSILIKTVADLFWFANEVNKGNTFKGKTVKLANDINLANQPWTPIGDCNSGNYFQGTFDGQGHTISNLYVNNSTDTNKYSTAGLFGWIDKAGATIQNVKVDGATIKGSHWIGVIAGYMSGKIIGCTVTNSVVEGYNVNDDANGDKVGGIVGYVNDQSYGLENNEVKDCTISGNREVAGIAGAVAKSIVNMNNNKVEDVILTYITNKDYASAGKIVSGRTGYVPNETNTAINVTIINKVASSTELVKAINTLEAGSEIHLADGEYKTVIDVTGGKVLTIKAAEENGNVVLAGVDEQSNANYSTLKFQGITFDNSLIEEGWFIGTAPNITVCVGAWGGNFTFEDCKFLIAGTSGRETGVMTWWTTEPAMTMTFKKCEFCGIDDHASARAMQIYGNVNLSVEDCTFTTKKDYSLKYVGNEGNTALFKGNTVSNSEYMVELGSSAYPGSKYTVTFENNILDEGIADYCVANDEDATIIGGTSAE